MSYLRVRIFELLVKYYANKIRRHEPKKDINELVITCRPASRLGPKTRARSYVHVRNEEYFTMLGGVYFLS
jgi:hypothetical protein